jgi:hypothetical protein
VGIHLQARAGEFRFLTGCTRPLGRPQGDTRGSTYAHAELRLQVLQGKHRSNGCDNKNENWKI